MGEVTPSLTLIFGLKTFLTVSDGTPINSHSARLEVIHKATTYGGATGNRVAGRYISQRAIHSFLMITKAEIF